MTSLRACARVGVVVGLALTIVGVDTPGAHGQVTTAITSSGLGTVVTTNGNVREITGGTRPSDGANLFHSFGQFSIGAGDKALFKNTTPGLATSNILSRVTGGDASNIYGTIDTSGYPGANFFLINPAGVVFGPGATLNVSGAFHATTASYVCLGAPGCLTNGSGKFFANPTENSMLTAAAPAAFGFLGPSGAISVEPGANLPGSPDFPVGQTLSLVGGDVRVTGSNLALPGGHLRIVSVASAGEVPLSTFDVKGLPTLGNITINADPDTGIPTNIDVSGDPAGSVVIRGGNVVLDTGTMMTAATGSLPGANPGIDVSARGQLSVNAATLISATSGDGRGGDIKLQGGDVQITVGSLVGSSREGNGQGGDIAITGNSVSLTGATIVSQNAVDGGPPSGSVTLGATQTMSISGGSLVASIAQAGDGGTVSVSASSLALDSGFVTSSTATGRGGDVRVRVSDLSMTNGAAISSTTEGPGRGGDVGVTATGSAGLTGAAAISTSSLFFDATAPELGSPGNIFGQFGGLTLAGGATIQSGVFPGRGGNVSLTADTVTISSHSGIGSQAFVGDVGRIQIGANDLAIDGGFISTSTLQSGQAGSISIDASTVRLMNGAQITSSSDFLATGRGGNVTINARDSVLISGRSSESVLPPPFHDFVNDTRSGVYSTTAGTARGGNILIQSNDIRLENGGTLSASSTSATTDGIAGNVNVNFGKNLTLDHATITTNSLVADGGNITITSTGSQLVLIDSQIVTSVQSGVGGGGNIIIGSAGHPVGVLVLDNGGIHADAFGGPGGNINIFTDVLLSNVPIDTAITASSQLSSSGSISVNAVLTDIAGSIAELPAGMLEAAALLRASCAVRMAQGKASSLVVAGREGIPVEPGGLLPSELTESRGARAADAAPVMSPTELRTLRLSYLDTRCGG